MRPRASAPAEQRHAPGAVEEPGQGVEVGIGRAHHGARWDQAGALGDGLHRRVLRGDVARDHDHRDAALPDRRPDRVLQHVG